MCFPLRTGIWRNVQDSYKSHSADSSTDWTFYKKHEVYSPLEEKGIKN